MINFIYVQVMFSEARDQNRTKEDLPTLRPLAEEEILLSTDFIEAFTIFGKGIRDFRMLSGELNVL